MAQSSPAKKASPRKAAKIQAHRIRPLRWLMRWTLRVVFIMMSVGVMLVLGFRVVDPPTTFYMWSEGQRLGRVTQEWVDADDIAPAMLRSAVAAEDANFCTHWGFDMDAIRAAIEAGGARGGSTISQQVVKNVFLWHGRTYTRKALEALITPMMEAAWPKRRILEVYLNVAEFDEGVFGVEAASRHYFGVSASQLSATQAARLAAVLPNPKARSASQPSRFVANRASQIRDGAATIDRDGRADCFQ